MSRLSVRLFFFFLSRTYHLYGLVLCYMTDVVLFFFFARGFHVYVTIFTFFVWWLRWLWRYAPNLTLFPFAWPALLFLFAKPALYFGEIFAPFVLQRIEGPHVLGYTVGRAVTFQDPSLLTFTTCRMTYARNSQATTSGPLRVIHRSPSSTTVRHPHTHTQKISHPHTLRNSPIQNPQTLKVDDHPSQCFVCNHKANSQGSI